MCGCAQLLATRTLTLVPQQLFSAVFAVLFFPTMFVLLQRLVLMLWRAMAPARHLLLSLVLQRRDPEVSLARQEAAQQDEEEEDEENLGWLTDANTDDFDDDLASQDIWTMHGHQQIYWDAALCCYRRIPTPPGGPEDAADEEIVEEDAADKEVLEEEAAGDDPNRLVEIQRHDVRTGQVTIRHLPREHVRRCILDGLPF